MEKLISINGKAKLSARPDLIKVILDIENKNECYDTLIEHGNFDISRLVDAFKDIGFKKRDLKTKSFVITSDYENYTDENNNYKRRFVGYKSDQKLFIEFDFNLKRLSEVIEAIRLSKVQPHIEFEFGMKDVESLKNKVIAKAVQDAKEKAKILADAGDLSLGDIVRIDYNISKFETMPRVKMETMSLRTSADVYLEPMDIVIEDSVLVVWEID